MDLVNRERADLRRGEIVYGSGKSGKGRFEKSDSSKGSKSEYGYSYNYGARKSGKSKGGKSGSSKGSKSGHYYY